LSDAALFAALDRAIRELKERPPPAAIIALVPHESGNHSSEHGEFLREVAENDLTFGLDKRPAGMTRHEAYLQTLGIRQGPLTPPPAPPAE
jgi:hypothetical protein